MSRGVVLRNLVRHGHGRSCRKATVNRTLMLRDPLDGQYRGAGVPPPSSFPATSEAAERKRTRLRSPLRVPTSDNIYDDPIRYWTQTGIWPKDSAEMGRERSVSPRKRLRTSSDAQSARDQETLRAYGPAYEMTLADSGIHMEGTKGSMLVKQESRDRCTEMLLSSCEEPHYAMFPLKSFLKVREKVRNRNKARIFRDITPLLVPSPEILVINGHTELEYIAEELNVEWTKCEPMAGPRPKPDLAMGISPSAFTLEEKAKLTNYGSIKHLTQFTEDMYFPFLVCEVRSGHQPLNPADRQNMHSGSVACRAIVELERSAGENRIQHLSGEILVYSISHDDEYVKIYGHFPVTQGEQTTFHRLPIRAFILNFEEDQGRKRTYDFVREVYRTVFPKHLKRVQDALKEMGGPRAQMEPESIVEGSALSTQDTGTFEIPSIPASKQHQEELSFIRDQFARQELLYKEQISNRERQYKELMAQQAQQMEKELAQQERQYKEQLDVLKGLLNRQ